jgi:IclR family acetate operon transcriptional repressor
MNQVRSVRRAIRILEAFRERSCLTVTELSRALKFPKSSVYELVCTLAAEGLLAREEAGNRYRLGLGLVELARCADRDLEVRRVAHPLIEKLRDELNETVQLTILDGEEILYVDGCESKRQLRTFFQFGDRAPLHCTALGKAILAHLPDEEIDQRLRRRTLKAYTSETLTDPRELRRELERTAARGYSIDDMEHEEGVRCVGAPIRDREGRAIASISASGPAQRLAPGRDREIARRVVAAAEEISRRLGYRPGKGGARKGP